MDLHPRSSRAVVAAGAALLLLAAVAGPAAAAPPQVELRNEPLAFPDLVDTESCPGLTILAHLEGKRSRTNYYNRDGELTRTVIQVRYWFTFTNVDDPSIVSTSPGHRHIELDYVNNTFTDTGIYRNVTMPGAGNIHHVTGRYVDSLETGEVVAINGPHEDLAEFCTAMAG
jgi:hypothetical protein